MTANTYATEDYADDAAAAAAAALVDAAPGALDTLNELAAALGDDAAFSTTVTNALALKAPLASPAFTGTPTGITKTHVGLGNVDNTTDAGKPVSTAQQTALDLKAPLASPTFTGTVAGVTKAHVGLGNVDNTADSAKTFAGEAITSGIVAIARLPLDADVATLALPASTTISAFGATLVDDANAAAAIATLGLDGDIATLALPASTTISAFGATLVDDAAASNARTTLGLDSMATQAASAVAITGGSVTGITDLVVADGGTGGSTHTNHGVLLGQAASPIVATAAGTTNYPLVSNGSGADPAFEQLLLTAGVQGILPIANGGLGSIPAWQPYTPTIDQGTATNITLSSIAFAQYIELADCVVLQVRLTIGAAGDDGNEISMSLPVAASSELNANAQCGSGFISIGGSNYKCIARITNTSGRLALMRTDNATSNTCVGADPNVATASGNVFTCTAVYEGV